MDINVTTKSLRVENVVGEAMKQVNFQRTITLPVAAKKIESVDTEIKDIEYKVIEDKIIVEAILHKQIYYVECITGDVQEFTVADEKITEFVHIYGAMPDMDADVDVDVEYCDVEAVGTATDTDCYTNFQQTCIIRIKAKIVEMLDIEVVTEVAGVGITPTYQTVGVDYIVGAGMEQYSLSDNFIELPDETKKIKNIDAEIIDVEEKIIPGKVIVKGKIHKQIYYVIEPGGDVKEMFADVPFSVFVPIEGVTDESDVSSDVDIEYIDSEMVTRNGKKYVKETIVLQIRAKATEHMVLSIVTAVAGAEVETRTLNIERRRGRGRRQVNILSNVVTPTPARKVARVDAELRDLSGEAITNKVIIKGTLHQQVYYVSAVDDQLRELTVEEPFTEFIPMEGAEEGDIVDVSGRIEYTDVEAMETTPTTKWRATSVIQLRARVTETEELTVVIAVKGAEVICPPGGTFDYVIQKGDTLSSIAQKFGVTVQSILAVNPQITNPNIIFTGRTIKIPCPPVGGMG